MRIDFEQYLRGAFAATRESRPRGWARMRGMTLIELMTVILVMSILVTIGASSYRKYLIRANRTDGTASLLRVQVAEEKYFLQNNIYTNNVTTLGVQTPTPQGYYALTVAPGGSGDIKTSFTATATPRNQQLSQDTDCATLTIDDRGQRGSTPGPTSTCWK